MGLNDSILFNLSHLVAGVESYGLVGKGISCSRDTTYTKNGCDGWARVSLEDCKRKCSINESPSNCENGETCRYVVWHANPWWLPGWCHLASDSCNIVSDENDSPPAELWIKNRAESG